MSDDFDEDLAVVIASGGKSPHCLMHRPGLVSVGVVCSCKYTGSEHDCNKGGCTSCGASPGLAEATAPVSVPKETKPESVENPAHYANLSPQPVEVILAWNLDWLTGNAIKYLARAGKKPGTDEITDLKKAISYISRRISFLEGGKVV